MFFIDKDGSLTDVYVGMTTFDESAGGNVLLEHFGFTINTVVSLQ
jgi:transketolase